MGQTVIKVENLNKVYYLYNKPTDRIKEAFNIFKKKYSKSYYALKDINLEVKKGETLGIIGTNGSGKSTLVKIITGITTATSGKVFTSGKISALLELGAGFNPEYTGIENIYLNGTMMGFSKKQIDKKLDQIIEFADIGQFIYQKVKTYSSGMFARLAFAVSISVEPEILIIDEILSVGDVRFQIKCLEKMKQLQKNGTTILFISHTLEQIKRFCTRAIWIQDGKLLSNGDVSKVISDYKSYLEDKQINEEQLKEDIDKKEEDTRDKNLSVAKIEDIRTNATILSLGDKLLVEIKYRIYDDNIEDFLLGVAIYTKDREYIFGPNTYLEDIEIPSEKGQHTIVYEIPKMPLIEGEFVLDVGIFVKKGLVCLDYKSDTNPFTIENEYISEGLVFIDHRWGVKK